MRSLLLIAHVFAAILFIGPATIGSSLFPRYATVEGRPVAELLHRLSRAYGTCSFVVPVVGIVLAARAEVLEKPWVAISLVLFVAGIGLLLGLVVPSQRSLLDPATPNDAQAGLIVRCRAGAGLYALTWLAVLVLMVVKP